ncbi:aldo/keto reductase [Pelagicoccus sp. SDUM812002]|uniref:aldo/keto reductase n=1 Tax=Pelagicoccus sp. SDUM812002 TaxID=3041266 RepID=UPI00280D7832|nr:aldo/keto reductase [Pelagicoccus sp. SDUM812002]MDQ8186663.1 aldo/keto reductase [Pelagicoccus sp. SDUM812002]
MKRRDFLGRVAGAAVAAPLIGSVAYSKPRGTLPEIPKVTFEKSGITTTRLAQGTGFNGWDRQSDQTRQGFEEFVNLLRHGYDRGIRLFDLADLYGTHYYFREALRFIPRDEVTILTKLWWRYNDENPKSMSLDEQRRSARTAVERFRMELDVEVIDILLMHNVMSPEWDEDMAGFIEVLHEYRDRGVIRALGMSCHTLSALERAAETEWVEVALTRINPYGKHMDGTPEEVMPVQRRFKERGANVIGMKIFGAGGLVDKREECMEFAQNLGYLDSMTIGARSPEEIDDNIRLMAKYPAK